jgi:uncharacterized OB-fold protein
MCGAADMMAPHRLAERHGTVKTFTFDHLAWGIHKPVCSAVIDFDGGGRMECEVADADPEQLVVDARVRMVLRRSHTTEGIHNYVWKALVTEREAA